MCNLYSLHRNRDVIGRLFRVAHNRSVAVDPLPAIFPGYQAPVVRQAADSERELVTMNWGFVLLQKDRAPKRVTNARDDKILSSPFWKTSFEQRRCLVPASSYCEPKGEKPATWHWFALKGEEQRPLFAFPGVWTRYKGPLKKDGEAVDQEVFAFMSRKSSQHRSTTSACRCSSRTRPISHLAVRAGGTGTQARAQLCSRSDAHRAVRIRARRHVGRIATCNRDDAILRQRLAACQLAPSVQIGTARPPSRRDRLPPFLAHLRVGR